MELRSGKTLNRPLAATDNVLDSNTKGEELSRPLPEELVERILAMVPFPQIFKARALSKSWHARLSSISSQDDEGKKLLAASFQKLVSEWSNKWMTSCPVFLFEEFLIAYDRAAQHWRRIPTLSVLPDGAAMKVKACMVLHRFFLPSMVGALLFITNSFTGNISVVNIFTRSWKELPALPYVYTRSRNQKRFVGNEEMYKVIMLWTDVGCARAWIYDSKLGSWSKRLKVLEVLEDFEVGWYDVYLNGVLYVVVHVQHVLWGFLAFDVENETFNLLPMPPTDIISVDVHFLQLVACNGTVYIVVPKNQRTVILLEADLVSRRWSKVIHGPPAALKVDFFRANVSSDGDCLFFYGEGRGAKILAYNVRKDEWSCLAKNRDLKQCLPLFQPFKFNISFQPGINPFLEV